jgi:hypothetical protein
MSLAFHPSMQGKDLGSEGTDIIARQLFQRIEDTAGRYESQSTIWETDILSALRLCQGVREVSESAQAYVLSIIQDHWDDMSIEFRREYDYQYAVLVLRETNVQPSTMDNYTRAAKVFFGEEGKKPLGPVQVTKYNQFKQPEKAEDGSVKKEFITFDPAKAGIAKLSAAAPLAKQDRMTPELWNMLADKEVTVEAFKKAAYKPVKTEDDSDPSFRLTLEGNRIVAHEYGEHIEIGELYFEMGEEELGRTGIRRVLMMLNIPHETDVISRMIQRARDTQVIRTYGDGLVIPTKD